MFRVEATFTVPPGKVAQVRVIDTTSRLRLLKATFLMSPSMPGFEFFPEMPSWSFLVEGPSGKKALFDLGVPTDFKDLSPLQANPPYMEPAWDIEVQKPVSEILQEHGVPLESISSIIWSHWHWDHLGNASNFPPSTEVILGPGFSDAFLPAYPLGEKSPMREKDFKGRQSREIDFTLRPLKIGKFQAFDFFEDGSFYLLDTPGHATGHLCGLARTSTNPDTFVMMGGDVCHHAGEMRPSRIRPLPSDITPNPFTSKKINMCPAAALALLQQSRSRTAEEPFFDPALGPDVPEAVISVRKSQEADGNDNVFFIYAHDDSIMGVVDLFPLPINKWKSEGWAEKVRWKFLADFQSATELAVEDK